MFNGMRLLLIVLNDILQLTIAFFDSQDTFICIIMNCILHIICIRKVLNEKYQSIVEYKVNYGNAY